MQAPALFHLRSLILDGLYADTKHAEDRFRDLGKYAPADTPVGDIRAAAMLLLAQRLIEWEIAKGADPRQYVVVGRLTERGIQEGGRRLTLKKPT